MNRSLNNILPTNPSFCALAVKSHIDAGNPQIADALIDQLVNEVEFARAKLRAAVSAKMEGSVRVMKVVN